MFLKKLSRDKKIMNTPTFFTHNATWITQDILLTGAPSPQQFTFSMVP